MGIYPIQYFWVNTNKGKEKQLLCQRNNIKHSMYSPSEATTSPSLLSKAAKLKEFSWPYKNYKSS